MPDQDQRLAPLRDIIAAKAGALSPRLRDAANFVLLNPDQVATRSLRHIAASASMSAPTFSRLARVLGFHDYEALREMCRQNLLRQQPSFAERADILQSASLSSTPSAHFITDQSKAAVQNIAALGEAEISELLDKTSQWISEADTVVVCGSLIQRHLAAYIVYMARMGSPKWRLFDDNGASHGDSLLDLSPASVVLAIATSPYARQTVTFAKAAKEQGARVVAITDAPLSPLGLASDLAIPVATDSPNFFPSFAALLVVLETLVGMTVAKGGPEVRDRIAAIEVENRGAGTYHVD